VIAARITIRERFEVRESKKPKKKSS